MRIVRCPRCLCSIRVLAEPGEKIDLPAPSLPPGKMSLTPRARDTLAFLRTTLKERGIAPSYQEIRAHLGLRSTSSVYRLVNQLAQRGHVQFLKGAWRSMTVVQ